MSMNLTIDGVKYPISEEITLGEYMTLQKYNKEDLTTPKLMEILTKIPEKEIRKIDDNRSLYIINKVMKQKMQSTESKKVYASFDFKGKTYGLETDLTKLNFGGWVDLETFISMGYRDNIDKVAAIYYRPIQTQLGKTYVLEPYDTEEMLKRAEEFQELPFKYIVGASSFFLQFTKTYIDDTKRILTRRTKKMQRRMKAVEYMKKVLPNWLIMKLPPDFIRPNL